MGEYVKIYVEEIENGWVMKCNDDVPFFYKSEERPKLLEKIRESMRVSPEGENDKL